MGTEPSTHNCDLVLATDLIVCFTALEFRVVCMDSLQSSHSSKQSPRVKFKYIRFKYIKFRYIKSGYFRSRNVGELAVGVW